MRVYLRTFGCRANHYDSEAVRVMLERRGAVLVESPAHADVAVYNSCAVTAEAEADLRQAVRRAARENPRVRAMILGCASALPRSGGDADRLDTLPNVQAVLAGADPAAVAAILDLPSPAADERPRVQSNARALLRIQDGCGEHCTFCATRLARGAARSRALDDLVAEATTLSETHPEIVLTGTHIGAYGQDLGTTLGTLVSRLVCRVPTVRFRLSSIEATEVDPELLELFGEPNRLAPSLHAPLQSGSDRVLRRMGRHWYTAAAYAAAVERVVAGRPVFGLSADIITGFPGETEEDHRLTIRLVAELPFTGLHVFPYSPRPGTAALRLPSSVAPAMARLRARELRELAECKAAAYRTGRAGAEADVVIEGAPDARRGITEDHLTVDVANGAVPRRSRARMRLAASGTRLIAVT